MQADDVAECTKDYSRLTRAEVASVLALHRAGKTQVEIAQVIGCNHTSVSRWLASLTDTRDLAKQILHSGASALAGRVVKHANVEESLEVLDRIDVAVKRQQDTGRVGVQVIVGMPGLPSGQDPVYVTPLIGHKETAKDPE